MEVSIRAYLVNVLLHFIMFSYHTRANSTGDITHNRVLIGIAFVSDRTVSYNQIEMSCFYLPFKIVNKRRNRHLEPQVTVSYFG